MSFQSLCNQLEADARQVATHDAWGHLGPKNGKHLGQVLYAVTDYGQTELISENFKEEFQNSPWQYDALNDMIFELSKNEKVSGVYCWSGFIVWGHDKNDSDDGTYMIHWEGDVSRLGVDVLFKTLKD